MDKFLHNSRLASFRAPLGACPMGTDWRVFCAAEGVYKKASVTLRLWEDGIGEWQVPMYRAAGGFAARLRLPDKPCLVWYYFILRLQDGTQLYYGGRSGEGALSETEPGSFRVTVYDGAYETPEWFRTGICYQIFPDRFFRSDDKSFQRRLDAHRARGRKVRMHADWAEQPTIEPDAGEPHYAPNDYSGGDLNGIRKKLDYLASFGVTCIYLNPVFEAASNHRYNTADYRTIDPVLGTNEEFAALCREAKARGIRIMLDGVFSHTGSDSVYFNREGSYGADTGAWRDPKSPYRSWYRFHPDKTPPYECWWGFESLPNVEELSPSYIDFIAGEHGVLKHWAELGATSWRLDVADELPDEFIRILRWRVKKNDPEGVLLGEVWEEPTAKRGGAGRRGYVNGDELDSVMNYCFRNAVLNYLRRRSTAKEFADELLFLKEQYPKPFYDAALNLLGSHDVIRLMTELSECPGRDDLTREDQRDWEPTPENAARARKRLPLAEALQVFLPGVPCLYYGDETGMTGMADPFNRAPYPWDAQDTELVEATRKLFAMRRDEECLKRGGCRMAGLDDDVFAAVRVYGGERMLLLVNAAEEEKTVVLSGAAFTEGTDGADEPFTGTWTDAEGKSLTLTDGAEIVLAPLSYTVCKREA
ncbi:MAG: glycoside hydrolase family 13 protein [Clostridia bacterium]|nr:glycoside hydrolase family 13 protein [Clostridia bacterium]